MIPPAVAQIAANQRYLAWWLVIVFSMRAFSVVMGYLKPSVLGDNVFPKAGKEGFNGLGGRLFAVWTVLSGAAALFTAANLDNHAMVWMGAFTFATALVFFLIELLVMRTMSLRTFMSPCIVASLSLTWLLYWLHIHGVDVSASLTSFAPALAGALGFSAGGVSAGVKTDL